MTAAPRAVLTGLGVIAPTGLGVHRHWLASLRGQSGIRRLDHGFTALPIGAAGVVGGFDADAWVRGKLRVQTDRWTWFALAAARLALADARLNDAHGSPYELSVVTASGSGGNEFGQREIQALWREHPSKVSAYQSIAWFYAASTGQISINHQMKGGCGVIVSDGAGGLDALRQARRLLAAGSAAVLVGGTEAALSPYALVCQSSLRQLYRGADALAGYRPFHPDTGGFLPGEGGALMVLEELGHARRRRSRIYAELLGHAATHDARHPSRGAPDGHYLARAVALALDRAGRTPDQVDAVFADGAGDAEADAAEVAALRAVFGDRLDRLPVTVPKTMTGRLLSGAAALDVTWAALALRTGVLPPTVHADPEATWRTHGLRLVGRRVRPPTLRTALVLARGIGGFNSAAVLGAVP